MITLFFIIHAMYWTFKACRKDYMDYYVFDLNTAISAYFSAVFIYMAFK